MAMSDKKRTLFCEGGRSFMPNGMIVDTARQRQALNSLAENDLYRAITDLFEIPEPDSYLYLATISIKLDEVQAAVNAGGTHGLHDWYASEDGLKVAHPPLPDIEAYISIFAPTTATTSALKNFGTNAKKGSMRASAAENITGKRYILPSLSSKLTIPKCKSPPSANPYLDFWAWSCRNLEWCGPCEVKAGTAPSHHVLPIFMHHFGCATPSHESLEILRILADGRAIADIGAGNGYWTFMLRRYGLKVHAVDSLQSIWRVNWLDDLVVSDGVKWLRRNGSGRDMLLLLVYPIVGEKSSDGIDGMFTRDMLDIFHGDTLAVVGTQNANGYTGFKDMSMDQYMEKEHKEWTKVVQIPLPSFAGKDEALFVFQRGDRVPKDQS